MIQPVRFSLHLLFKSEDCSCRLINSDLILALLFLLSSSKRGLYFLILLLQPHPISHFYQIVFLLACTQQHLSSPSAHAGCLFSLSSATRNPQMFNVIQYYCVVFPQQEVLFSKLLSCLVCLQAHSVCFANVFPTAPASKPCL